MLRCTALLLLAFVLLSSLNCQSYTSGLQQTGTRVDETVVVSTLRTIATAQRAYSISNGGDYGTLEQLTEGGYLDQRFNSPQPVKDYVLTMKVNPKADDAPEPGFVCNADPAGTGPGTGRHFYVDSSSAIIHVNANQPASASDPVMQ